MKNDVANIGKAAMSVITRLEAENRRLELQLERANRIIGWMMPYIGKMCPPSGGLYDLNLHCCDNRVPESGIESRSAPLEARCPTEDLE